MEYNLLNEQVSVKASNVVKLADHFTLLTPEGALDLRIDIVADFESIPTQYHEVFVNILTAKYLNKVSFGDNPFSQCKPYVKRKWWEFWKPKMHRLNLPTKDVAITQ